jgi:hypothetical protein
VGPFLLSSLLLLGEIGYVVAGLRLVGARWSVYLALLSAPFYMLWKLWTIAIALAHHGDGAWVRTARVEKDV